MLRQNKLPLILSSAIILLPLAVATVLWFWFPDVIASPWHQNDNTGGWSTRNALLFLLPVVFLVIHWICMYFTLNDPKNKEQSSKVFELVLWLVPTFSFICSSVILSSACGRDIGSMYIGHIFLGSVFLILVNYMPKCKQNYTIGIKVPWTLHSEENWNKTHRFTGKLWMTCGIIWLIITLFSDDVSFSFFAPILLALAVGPIAYSYFYYRIQLKEGTVTSKQQKTQHTTGKRYILFSAVSGVVCIVFVAFFLSSGTIRYTYEDTSFTVNANYWEDVTVSYTDINRIEYMESMVAGKRIFGYGSFSLMMGEFENEVFGAYTRYSFDDCDACVVLDVSGKILVLNAQDEKSTRELYETLLLKIN